MLDKNIREHVNQYNLKHRNDKGVWSDKDMTQIPPCQAILLENQTNRDVHEEYIEDEGYDYEDTVDNDEHNLIDDYEE